MKCRKEETNQSMEVFEGVNDWMRERRAGWSRYPLLLMEIRKLLLLVWHTSVLQIIIGSRYKKQVFNRSEVISSTKGSCVCVRSVRNVLSRSLARTKTTRTGYQALKNGSEFINNLPQSQNKKGRKEMGKNPQSKNMCRKRAKTPLPRKAINPKKQEAIQSRLCD